MFQTAITTLPISDKPKSLCNTTLPLDDTTEPYDEECQPILLGPSGFRSSHERRGIIGDDLTPHGPDEVRGDGSAELFDDGSIEIEFPYHDGDEAILKAKRDASLTAC